MTWFDLTREAEEILSALDENVLSDDASCAIREAIMKLGRANRMTELSSDQDDSIGTIARVQADVDPEDYQLWMRVDRAPYKSHWMCVYTSSGLFPHRVGSYAFDLAELNDLMSKLNLDFTIQVLTQPVPETPAAKQTSFMKPSVLSDAEFFDQLAYRCGWVPGGDHNWDTSAQNELAWIRTYILQNLIRMVADHSQADEINHVVMSTGPLESEDQVLIEWVGRANEPEQTVNDRRVQRVNALMETPHYRAPVPIVVDARCVQCDLSYADHAHAAVGHTFKASGN